MTSRKGNEIQSIVWSTDVVTSLWEESGTLPVWHGLLSIGMKAIPLHPSLPRHVLNEINQLHGHVMVAATSLTMRKSYPN